MVWRVSGVTAPFGLSRSLDVWARAEVCVLAAQAR